MVVLAVFALWWAAAVLLVFALIGDRDPQVTTVEAADWARHTSAEFELRSFPGGHFYLADNQEAVVRVHADAAVG